MSRTEFDVSPDISVVVVTWNSAAVIGDFIGSLRGATSERLELIVIDNASRDGTLEAVRSLAPEATVVANDGNRGLAAANNQGLVASRAPFVLIANPDVVFRVGALDEMVAVMRRRPRAAWVVPRILYEDGGLQTSAGDVPSLSEALFGRQLARRRSAGLTSGFWWDGWGHDEERRIGRGHECAYVVRRDAVVEVGVQDERYVLDWEGVDWAERFNRAGWEIWLAPAAEVVHLGGTSIRQVPVRSTVLTHKGMFHFFASRRPWYWIPPLAAGIGGRALLKVALLRMRIPMYRLAFRAEGAGHR